MYLLAEIMNRKLKYIYWFAYYNTQSPSVRYRGLYPLQYLEKEHGIRSAFIVPGYHPAAILRFIIAYCSALFFRKKDSLIVVQRVHSNFIYANLLKLLLHIRKTDTLYDLDDADYLEYPPETIYRMFRLCAAVSVGSHAMEQFVSRYNSRVLLNTSPVPDLQLVKKERQAVFTIGWIGGYGGDHKKSLQQFCFPAVNALPFPTRLVLLGVTQQADRDELQAFFKNNPLVELLMPEQVDWLDEVAIQNYICQFDAGIATLMDNEFQRSKSAFKLKQYMNNGVPVLSSPIPENSFFITHGVNGFCCATVTDFKTHLTQLHEMPDAEYAALAGAARASTSDFSLENYCNTLLAHFPFEKKTHQAPGKLLK
jgi:glycosyltransferase involved in cell wall biosynthesis